MALASLAIFAGALPDAGSARKLFFAGLTVTLGNPKIMMFASKARLLLKSSRAVKIANRRSAGLMAGAAVAIATK